MTRKLISIFAASVESTSADCTDHICSLSSDCCRGWICVEKSCHRACLLARAPCSNSSQCCTGLCVEDTCHPACLLESEKCTYFNDADLHDPCCPGLHCKDNSCKMTTTPAPMCEDHSKIPNKPVLKKPSKSGSKESEEHLEIQATTGKSINPECLSQGYCSTSYQCCSGVCAGVCSVGYVDRPSYLILVS